jgi:hypothetical protein
MAIVTLYKTSFKSVSFHFTDGDDVHVCDSTGYQAVWTKLTRLAGLELYSSLQTEGLTTARPESKYNFVVDMM